MQNQRLKELKNKRELMNDEMKELISLSPPGTFVESPINIKDTGVRDIKKCADFINDANRQAQMAYDSGCFLEIIVIRAALCEFWLRFWLAHKGEKFEPDSSKDKQTFGQIITEAERADFPTSIIKPLRDFKDERNDVMHRLALGMFNQSELKRIIETYNELDSEVYKFVTGDCFG